MNLFENVVITGVSCRLPESANMAEFRDNLMNGVDMVTEDDKRWKQGIYGLPKGNGKLKDLSKFDAEFFGISPKQTDRMDPQIRLLLEVSYEALVDAGQCPETSKGSNTGVFIGATSSDSSEAWASDPETVSGYTMTGCAKSYLANRLSYFFNFKGPSMVLDTACSSSCIALHYAVQSIRLGQCDAALVGGSNLCLKPSASVQFKNLGMLSPEGRCKSFDANADGYCRSEGIVVIYLQKCEDARRIYCHVVNTGTNNDGYKMEGITYPSSEMQCKLLERIYSEANVDPKSVSYVEMHGTGTQAGDKQEANMINDFFGETRETPLLIGTVKSNMGHCETASGMASIAKVIVAMEEGVIPGNLHFNQPNPNVAAFLSKKLKVVDKNTAWSGGYTALNNFGFGGSNAHAILKSAQTENEAKCPTDKKKLMCYSARTEDGVKHVLLQAQLLSANDHFLALVCETINQSPRTQTYRGFTILNGSSDKERIILHETQNEKRPVWYIFSGMGCQWDGMGCQMMCLDIFRKSILKCERAVSPYGLRLSQMLMGSNESTYEDIENAFVAIAAIQVALVDLLCSVGIKPDGLIGHSVGEHGCAYADGCITAEETVEMAYWRARCIKQANLPPGKMAVVGLTWEEATKRCPNGVVPACHNGADSVTISGPKAAVEDFVRDLGEENIFAKVVNTAGFAFHSYFMKEAETSLFKMFSRVIKSCHVRSQRWISTSISQNSLGSDLAKYSSPEYHVNNVLSSVYFHDALQKVPGNAVVIEIAPRGLLQAVLRRSLSRDCYITSLMQRSSNDNVEFCLTALGNVYLQGISVKPQALLTAVTYPVPTGTPMLSPLISWKHDHNWQVPSPDMFVNSASTGGGNIYSYVIDTSQDSEYHYLTGHKIDGRILFPAAGYLLLAWKSFARLKGTSYNELPVSFENIRFRRAVIIPESGNVKLVVTLMPVTGKFEIVEAGSVVSSGSISSLTEFKPRAGDKTSSNLMLSSTDVYKELRLRGYDYGGLFKGILQLDLESISGTMRWSKNFVAFVDTMIQMMLLSQFGQDLRLPTSIKSVCIDPQVHQEQVTDEELRTVINVKSRRCISGGVILTGLVLSHFTFRRYEHQPKIETSKLHLHNKAMNIPSDKIQHTYVNCTLHLALQILEYLEDNSADVNLNIPEYAIALKNDTNVRSQGNDFTESDYDDNKFSLMKAFRAVLNERNADEMLKRHRASLTKARNEDCVFSVITKPEYLAPCIETVVENVQDNLRVIELAAPKLKDHIEDILDGYVNLKYSYDILDVQNAADSAVLFPLTNRKPNLVVIDNVFHHQANLSSFVGNIVSSLDDGGFLLVKEVTNNFILQYLTEERVSDVSVKDWELRTHGLYYTVSALQKVFTCLGLMNVYEIHETFLYSMFLLRKRSTRHQKNCKILAISSLECDWLEDMKMTITELNAERQEDRRLWLYADNFHSGILGMVKCLRKEPGGHRIRCVLNNRQTGNKTMKEAVAEVMDKDLVVNVLNDNEVGSYRFVPHRQEKVSCNSSGYYYVDIQTYGDLSSISWLQTCLKTFKQSAEYEVCKVEYAALNFRDVMLATGKLSPDAIPGNNNSKTCLLGMEFSGSNSNGNHVMGIVPAKGLASHVDVGKEFLWNVPDEWSLSDAAGIPVAYSTAYYALIVRGRLKRGEKVLIHSGSGGVGQAALNIALSKDCEVFTTVGTAEKRTFLQSTFPSLKPENIFSSRDLSFEAGILDATSGYGVDLVLNSLSGDKLKASLNVVAVHGRFLEIGKVDFFADTNLGMSSFLKNMSFHGILLDTLFENGNVEWNEVSRLIEDGINTGVVRPINTTVFKIYEVEKAFRFMAQGKHIGKVLIQVDESIIEDKVSAIPKFVCSSKKSYIIIGGLGGFGLELAHWLSSKGAKSIILTSRSGVRNGYQARKIQNLQKSGVDVVVSRKNAADSDEAREIVQECSLPCGGVFNTAMVLDDGLLENQTAARFRKVIEPKLLAAINLDNITRSTCKDSCDYFVMFSSISSGHGNAGQSNYGFANSGMERICEQRKRDGLHGLAIQWGVIGDVGVVFEQFGDNNKEIAGSIPQRLRSCLTTLDIFLTQSEPVVSSYMQATKQSKINRASLDGESDILKAVCHIIGIHDISKVNRRSLLESFGLDSLMTVEIIQTIERMTDVRVNTTDVRHLTLQEIQNMDKKDIQ